MPLIHYKNKPIAGLTGLFVNTPGSPSESPVFRDRYTLYI